MILSVDGKAFTSDDALRKYLGAKRPGDVVRMNVWSQGVKKFVAVTLEERPADYGAPAPQPT